MAWRKWFVRFLVFGIVGACAFGVVLYQRFTNPAAVREQVLAKLKAHFPGGVATIDSARLRILGGINVNELRLARRDDPDKSEILHVPSAVLYHDGRQIARINAFDRQDGSYSFSFTQVTPGSFRLSLFARKRSAPGVYRGVLDYVVEAR